MYIINVGAVNVPPLKKSDTVTGVANGLSKKVTMHALKKFCYVVCLFLTTHAHTLNSSLQPQNPQAPMQGHHTYVPRQATKGTQLQLRHLKLLLPTQCAEDLHWRCGSGAPFIYLWSSRLESNFRKEAIECYVCMYICKGLLVRYNVVMKVIDRLSSFALVMHAYKLRSRTVRTHRRLRSVIRVHERMKPGSAW